MGTATFKMCDHSTIPIADDCEFVIFQDSNKIICTVEKGMIFFPERSEMIFYCFDDFLNFRFIQDLWNQFNMNLYPS